MLKFTFTLHCITSRFFASHKPQLQLSAEYNCYLSASQNETELANLCSTMIVFCLNHGIGGRDQIIKQEGEEQKQKEQKGV